MPLNQATPSSSVLSEAVKALHEQYFTANHSAYARWQVASRVKDMAPFRGEPRALATTTTGRVAELTLFFLLWTEAANLRHTPELLCLLFFLMHNSELFQAVLPLLLPGNAAEGPGDIWLPEVVDSHMSCTDRGQQPVGITAELMNIRKEVAERITHIARSNTRMEPAGPSGQNTTSNSEGGQDPAQEAGTASNYPWDTLLVGWVGPSDADGRDPPGLWPDFRDVEHLLDSPVKRQLAALGVLANNLSQQVSPASITVQALVFCDQYAQEQL
jgi:hypothetical protein